jgi:hypothetical protein
VIKYVQESQGGGKMKQPALLCVLFALSLVACQPIQPVGTTTQQATTTQPTDQQTDDDKIANALSAGPASIAEGAAVVDWPIDPTLGEGQELRAGTNGWVCRPDDPTTPTDDPRCLDENWRNVFGLDFGPEREAHSAIGVSYMLQGGSVADNDDPLVMEPAAGQEWQIDPPHIMLVSPKPWDPALFSSDHHSGGPWIMFGGTPAEHLMIPVEMVAIEEIEDKVQNALSAGPASIAEGAAVIDWPIDPTLGEGQELRAGTNGWVCRPDDPTTPTNDPRCLDENWRNVFGLEFGTEREAHSAIGVSYMLQGGSVADNDDPSVMEPASGEEWQIDPPHIMLVSPYPWDPALFSSDHQSGGPWIMFGGTPAEHLMIPVTEHSH